MSEKKIKEEDITFVKSFLVAGLSAVISKSAVAPLGKLTTTMI